VRILFDEVSLGDSSYVVLRSAADGGEQRFDAVTIEEWYRGSAVFNGSRVSVELFVAPGDENVSVGLRSVLAGGPPPDEFYTACGTDDRVGSTDNRVGRLFFGGCTAWRIGSGALLTAGHCADFDPDQAGPMLPDLTLDLAGVVEFNVPASNSNGMTVAANPNDQYPINVTNVQWRFDGEGQGLGKDWCVFTVNRNANTLLLPHQVYGLPYRITREVPALNETARVTGFGSDGGTANFTNQTSAGPFMGESNEANADIWITHRVDTEGGNSGSPVLWDQMDLAYGIHTNGGCTSASGTSNSGTSFEVNALENAINGNATTFVDAYHQLPVAEAGTLMRPWNSIAEGVTWVPTSGTVSIWPGLYALPSGTQITRAMRLTAPVGAVVVIGN
jgi:V8-like Glu-specific endopeptidase